MTRDVAIRLTGELYMNAVPGGQCVVPETALPVRCFVTGYQRSIGAAWVKPRDSFGLVADVKVTLAPSLWLFGASGLMKYPNLSFGAKPDDDGVWWMREVWLSEPGPGSWPYTVETEWPE